MPQAWEGIVDPPVQTRVTEKPRATGYTMVLDKGLGLHATADLMQMAAPVIDSLKLTFGTSAFYEESTLREKIALVQDAGVDIYPGGTFLEAAVAQGKVAAYVKRARELGFNTIEVSDGTIEMDAATRNDIVKRAKDAGFKVLTEVGKKDPKDAIATTTMHEQIAADLAQGAYKVIVEARESGHGVGIFDSSGDVQTEMVEEILGGINNVEDLIWEAPIKNQQQWLILEFGPNVNLGNIPPDDILALEALRCGMRGDTLKQALAGTWP
ncbi:MAG: phosphosulfolactate synthase [Chloroflexota bacterium]|nr:phosphosulfolactate synthase [Chloroflexota bacterium]MDE2841445.1 phosphosulfolactate synthase [Chloroflexota bacterium]MDE2929719.1 phosphosulfolactate synthase [Chloroflexota bacterium]